MHLQHFAPTLLHVSPKVEDLTNFGIIAGLITTIVFLIQYQIRTKGMWRKNPAGRAIVALDICLAIIFIPASLKRLIPGYEMTNFNDWTTAIALCFVPFIVLYRIISLEIGRHRRFLDRKLKLGTYVENEDDEDPVDPNSAIKNRKGDK